MTGASLAPTSHQAARTALQRAFPDWKIWESDAGHCYATRRGELADRVRRFRLWSMVDATDLTGLRAELQDQERRAETPLALYGTLA